MTPRLTRRSFVERTVVLGAAPLALGWPGGGPAVRGLVEPRGRQDRPAPLRLLVLGGTGFLGPHMVRTAQARGHEVTIFNRGRTNPGMFEDVEELIGDRAGQLEALEGREWDVVIDNSGYYPEHVELSTALLADQVGHYIFTATTDVYRDYDTPGMTEDYPLGQLPDGAPHDPRQYYGPLKVLCEGIVRDAFPGRNTVCRPTWVAGPGDNNHLWTYWVMRMHDGGEVLAPGDPEGPIQWVDVRDLADFYIHRAETMDGGTYHLVAPPMTMREMLYGIRATTSADVDFTWVDADFLWEQGMRPWVDFPLWWPARNDYAEPVFGGIKGGEGSALLDGTHAWNAGLGWRPLADMAFATHDWYVEAFGDWTYDQRPGPTREREAEILGAWKSR
jgi:2'-hydroxyisoflavone reductase